MPVSSFTHWAVQVRALANRVEELRHKTTSWQLSDLNTIEWYGELQQKLIPQLSDDPYLIVAVCGGTNTGKSIILNHLADFDLSRSHAEATQTKHPVCSLPVGFAEQHDLARVFPGFELREWRSAEDALAEGPDNLLFWRTDPTGRQPARLLLLDTPDLDGVLTANHRRAELVRHASDVLVAVLTQQKYNDAAVRDFFKAAARADKTILAVVNMVHWPRQSETVQHWLATFTRETGCRLTTSYAVPWDDLAAEARTLTFHPLTTGAKHPRVDLAELQFDQIKLQTLSGSLQSVLDEQRGLPAQLRVWAGRATEYTEIYQLLAKDLQVPVRGLPQVPRQLLWGEIWSWLDERRNRWERTINQLFSVPYRWLSSKLSTSPASEEKQYREQEWDAFRLALEDFLARLSNLRRGGNPILQAALSHAAPSIERAKLFAELDARYRALPMLTDDFRNFVRNELQHFAEQNPTLLQAVSYSMVAAAVVRPVVTIGLGFYGAHAVDLAGGYLVNLAGDVVVGTATTVAGEGLFAGAMLPVQHLLSRLFNRYYAERGTTLGKLLHELVLGNSMTELHQAAELTNSAAWVDAQRLLVELRADSGRRTASQQD